MLDSVSRATGRAAAWLTLTMVILTVVIVVMRYAFDAGFIWLQEALVWMHGAVFMLGAAYTLQQDEHVRVDIFYRKVSATGRAWVNALGVVLFLLPICGFLLFESFDYVRAAWRLSEVSRDSGGLPYPAIPLLKSLLLVMPLAVALQGMSMLVRALRTIRGGR